MPKIKQLREQKGLTQLQLAEMLKVTRPMVSYFESYDCLPTPTTMDELLTKLDCNIEDIYSKSEFDFAKIKKAKCIQGKIECIQRANGVGRVTNYNFCVRLKKADFPLLTKTTLSECGFHNLRDLLATAYAVLEKRYKKLNKKEV